MSTTPTTHTTEHLDAPASWPAVAAGLTIFLIAAVFVLSSNLPTGFASTAPPALFALAIWGMVMLPAVGVALGWFWCFPRWSYPYAGLAAAMTLYMTAVATPGLRFFGYPTFGREVWGLRAWLPLALAVCAGWLVTRSFRSLRLFFTQMSADWTLPVYALTGFLPLYVFITFDEIDNAYSFGWQLVACVLLLAMVVIYLRSRTQPQRILSLLAGTFGVVATASLASGLYWYRLGPENIYIPGAIGMAVCVASFFWWLPLTLGIARFFARLSHRLGRAGNGHGAP